MSEQDSCQGVQNNLKLKQQAQRKFGCPCGKWYLSYPALFTHVKQKHQGKPPGQLIKPKTQKPRGRPRLPLNTPEDDQSVINFNYDEQIEKLLQNEKEINYNAQFEYSEGNQSCKDMGSQFLRGLQKLGKVNSILVCFMNYLKHEINKKYENGQYWQKQKPCDIIDVTNDIVRDLDEAKEEYPIQKNTLIELLFILFKWMYKNKWTDHKLVKKDSEENKQNVKI